jgi:hypothetical protein
MIALRTSLFVGLIVFGALCAQGDPPTAIPLYNLQDNTYNDWVATISINGVPVVHTRMGGGLTPLDGLVVNGDNRLDIEATQTNTTDHPLEVILFSGVLNDPYRTQINSVSATLGKVGALFHRSLHFNAQIPVRFPWQDGEHFDSLSSTDQTMIFAKYQELVSAVKAGNPDQIADFYEIGIRVGAMRTGQNPSEVRATLVKMLTNDFAKKAGPAEIQSQNEMKLVPCGQITLLAPKTDPPKFEGSLIRIPTSKGGSDSSIQRSFSVHALMFSKIQGQWKVVN